MNIEPEIDPDPQPIEPIRDRERVSWQTREGVKGSRSFASPRHPHGAHTVGFMHGLIEIVKGPDCRLLSQQPNKGAKHESGA